MSDPVPVGAGRQDHLLAPPRPPGHDRLLLAAAAASLVAVGLVAVVVVLEPMGTRAASDLSDVAQVLAPLVAAAACGWAARRSRERGWRVGWALVGLSCLSWAVGQLVWTWLEVVQGHSVPFPSVADAFYLLAMPLAALGLLGFPSSPSSRAGRARLVLDGLVVAMSVLFVSWAVVIGPTLRDGTGSAVDRAIGLSYPAGDVVLLTIVILAFVRFDPAGRRAVGLVGLGFAAFALADSSFAYTTLHDHPVSSLSNVAWFAGYLLVALGAMHAARTPSSHRERLESTRATSRLVVLLPYAPVAVVLALSGVEALVLDPIVVDDGLFWIGLTLILALLVRQAVVSLENARLARSLELSNDQLRYQVLHDALTGLPNRPLYLDRLRVALARMQRVTEVIAVMFVDLDGFKPVNDTLGHGYGDALLTELGEQLAGAVRAGDTVARFGGDEFLVLCEDVSGVDEAMTLAERVSSTASRAVVSGDRQLPVTASVGLVVTDDPTTEADELVRLADAAMYRAKQAGPSRIELVTRRRPPGHADRQESPQAGRGGDIAAAG